jgi:ubiquinone/menaquinone biosynthesis C-methylase UbiE
MDTAAAIELIRGAQIRPGQVWIDFGAGKGVLTRALAELVGPQGRIYAVDQDAGALAELERWARAQAAPVTPVRADLTQPFRMPPEETTPVDGMLFGNVLHFVAEAEVVLARLTATLLLGGQVAIVEYDQRVSSRWVPYPIPIERLPAFAAAAGLSTFHVTATRPSTFGGALYAAVARRPVRAAAT